MTYVTYQFNFFLLQFQEKLQTWNARFRCNVAKPKSRRAWRNLKKRCSAVYYNLRK